MRSRTILIAVVLVLAFCSALYSDSGNPFQGKRPVKLGPAADVSTSAVTRQVLKGNMHQLAHETRALAFEIDPAACAVYPAPEGYEYLKVNDLKPTGRPGEPELPMKTLVVEVDRADHVYGVEIAKDACQRDQHGRKATRLLQVRDRSGHFGECLESPCGRCKRVGILDRPRR